MTMFSGLRTWLVAIMKHSDKQDCQISHSRVARFTNLAITFIIIMMETWFWCLWLYLQAWGSIGNNFETLQWTGLPDLAQQGYQILHIRVARFTQIANSYLQMLLINSSTSKNIILQYFSFISCIFCELCRYYQIWQPCSAKSGNTVSLSFKNCPNWFLVP